MWKTTTCCSLFPEVRFNFYNQPLLWVRLAECCLLALEKGLLKPHRGSSISGEDVKVHVIGTGKWRQVVIEDAASRNGILASVEVDR